MQTPTVVFVLSSTRSGSTWLGYVLASCPKAAFLGEYYRAWNESLRRPCAWCAASGATECSVLHGIESVAAADAFSFAFQRTYSPILIDISKSLEWTADQIEANPSFQFKLIHLIRDPRGWYASERRRLPIPVDELLDLWTGQNRRIAQFVEDSRCASTTVFYDELAADPYVALQPVCNFAGLRYHPAALQYWQHPHHGFAANGASSFLLHERWQKSGVPDFSVTGDDSYYSARTGSLFIDDRWKTTLSGSEIGAITGDTDVCNLLAGFDRTMLVDGLCSQSPVGAVA